MILFFKTQKQLKVDEICHMQIPLKASFVFSATEVAVLCPNLSSLIGEN